MRLNLASGDMRRGDDEIMRGLCLLGGGCRACGGRKRRAVSALCRFVTRPLRQAPLDKVLKKLQNFHELSRKTVKKILENLLRRYYSGHFDC
jgi:hypothetical protein